MVKEVKKESVSDLVDKFTENRNAYVISYQGVNVEKITKLRSDLKANQSEMKIFKNTLAIIALREARKEVAADMEKVLTGSTGIIFAKDPVAPAKILVQFAKENSSIEVKGAILENVFIEGKSVKDIAALPSKEVLIAKLLMLMNSPITGLVGALQGNIRNLVYTLSAVKDKKGI